VLLLLLVAEALIAVTYIRIQPSCEPCLPGFPCEPCISDDQRALVMIGGLLPVGVVLAQIIVRYHERRNP
jgi:hypothetical protein